jgi:hypothetical protein
VTVVTELAGEVLARLAAAAERLADAAERLAAGRPAAGGPRPAPSEAAAAWGRLLLDVEAALWRRMRAAGERHPQGTQPARALGAMAVEWLSGHPRSEPPTPGQREEAMSRAETADLARVRWSRYVGLRAPLTLEWLEGWSARRLAEREGKGACDGRAEAGAGPEGVRPGGDGDGAAGGA